MTCDPPQLGRTANHRALPITHPTLYHLLNLMMKETRCLPREQPPSPAAPPESLQIKPHAKFHAKHCIMLLGWDLLMPLTSQSPVASPKINIQDPSLKLKNTAMALCTLSRRRQLCITGNSSKILCSKAYRSKL